MMNLHLIQWQPHWRVRMVALFAQMVGVRIHVEGIPFGSSRNVNPAEFWGADHSSELAGFNPDPLPEKDLERLAELGRKAGWKSC